MIKISSQIVILWRFCVLRFKLSKAALDYPTFWDNLEGMEFVALGDFHRDRRPQNITNALPKRRCISPQALHPRQRVLAAPAFQVREMI
jgi:hypothetical protein